MSEKQKSRSIAELISQRRTIHDFKPEPVPDRQAVIDAIHIARWAPNHHLTEPWHIYLLGQESKDAIISLNTEMLRKSKGEEVAARKQLRWSTIPGWLVITCDRSADPLQEREDYAACCCLVQNLMLVMWEKEIGMKWSTGPVIHDERFYDLLWIDPAAEKVVGLFWYGYPDIIPVTARKPVEQLLVELP
ncbi:MAG TPA: nitroreductase [Gammaproteobacteria bacterium]|nr:nitroreductase [Gammaproteobacteria bacterium]